MDTFDGAAAGQDLRSSIDGLTAMVTGQNAKLNDVRRQMTELRGTGKAADERVAVEVDQFGALAGLTIDPRAMRLGSQQLAEAILEAARQGVRDVNAQAEKLMRPLITEFMGADRRIDAADTADTAAWDLDEIIAAMQDVRHDLRM
jgi:DNA-binding protein YbaB